MSNFIEFQNVERSENKIEIIEEQQQQQNINNQNQEILQQSASNEQNESLQEVKLELENEESHIQVYNRHFGNNIVMSFKDGEPTIVIGPHQLAAYLQVAIKNPGIASSQQPLKNKENIQHQDYICQPCQIVRTKGTYHCTDCDVCILGYDHHCPWTGKCIGKGNIGEFFCFLCSTVLFMVYNIIMGVSIQQ